MAKLCTMPTWGTITFILMKPAIHTHMTYWNLEYRYSSRVCIVQLPGTERGTCTSPHVCEHGLSRRDICSACSDTVLIESEIGSLLHLTWSFQLSFPSRYLPRGNPWSCPALCHCALCPPFTVRSFQFLLLLNTTVVPETHLGIGAVRRTSDMRSQTTIGHSSLFSLEPYFFEDYL